MPRRYHVYPPEFQTWITVDQVARPLEGERRPGHFRGVCLVVAKLFHICQPDRAYFGEKDAQQLALITQMVENFFMRIEIVPCETVRENDGLALSSRNVYLNPHERTESLKLTLERVLPYWHEAIVPDLRAGRRILIAAHGNSRVCRRLSLSDAPNRPAVYCLSELPEIH